MKKFVFLFFWVFQSYAQISSFKQVSRMPIELAETSALLNVSGRLFTLNDSGHDTSVFEIDPTSSKILRKVKISNAQNVDWEALSQDDSYVYIGDFGNASGDRRDLKIFKISKADLLKKEVVDAETIAFTYEGQTDFTPQLMATNWDAEAMLVWENELYVFTKNWGNQKTTIFKMPVQAGNHTAKKVVEMDTKAMITDGVVSKDGKKMVLTAYSRTLAPSIIVLSNFTKDNFATTKIQKIRLSSKMGIGSQLEGITLDDNNRYYLSRENIEKTVLGVKAKFAATLYLTELNLL